jgi:hypothetical protein
MSEVFMAQENGTLIKVGNAHNLKMTVEADSSGRFMLSDSQLPCELTISCKPSWPLIEYLTGDYTFGRLRQQMKAKLRGKNWRNVR